MNAPLSMFLVEFTGEPIAEAYPDLELEPVASVASVTLTPDELELRLDEIRTEAAATGRAEAEAELTASFEAERIKLIGEFEAEREALVQNYGQALSESLTTVITGLESTIAEALAEALRPVFEQACRTRILGELAATIRALLADPGHPALCIEGPVDLLTAFGNAHGGELALDYVVSDQAELTIAVDGSRVVTRLTDCLARFQTSEG